MRSWTNYIRKSIKSQASFNYFDSSFHQAWIFLNQPEGTITVFMNRENAVIPWVICNHNIISNGRCNLLSVFKYPIIYMVFIIGMIPGKKTIFCLYPRYIWRNTVLIIGSKYYHPLCRNRCTEFIIFNRYNLVKLLKIIKVIVNSDSANALVDELLFLLNADLSHEKYIKTASGNGTIDTIKHYMESHLKEIISLDLLSKISNLEKSYLIRFFKKETGQSPKEYLKSIRSKLNM